MHQISITQALENTQRPAITADFDNGHFILTWQPFSQEVNDLLKREVAAQWNPQRKYWYCAKSEENVLAMQRLDVAFTEAAQAAILWLSFDLEETELASTSDTTDFRFNWDGAPIRPYQFRGIEYLLNCKHGILADDQGLGKTLQILGAMYYANLYPALIICPSKLKGNWEDEIRKVANIQDKEIFLVSSAADIEHSCQDQLKIFQYDYYCPGCKFDRADIVITNPDQYPDGWTDDTKKVVKLSALAKRIKERRWKLVAIDEFHSLKNWGSQRTAAVKASTYGAEYKFGITGTPLINDIDEVCTLLGVVEALHFLGGWSQFQLDWIEKIGAFYFDAKGKRRRRSAEQIEKLEQERKLTLNKKLRQTCFIRRLKSEVAKDLPPKVRQSLYVEIDNPDEYRKAERKLHEWVSERVLLDRQFMDSISSQPKHVQQMLIRARQDEKVESAMRGEYMVRLMALRRVTAEGKLKAAKEYIDSIKGTGQKILVFAIHKDILDALLSWYPKAARILSSSTDQEVRDNKELFQTDPNCWLMILAMGTHVGASPGGVGHTLTAASIVLFVEHGFTSAHIRQCEDRAHRIGSENWGHECINVIHLLGKLKKKKSDEYRNTIEVKLAEIIDKKRKLAEAVCDGLDIDEGETGIMAALLDYMEHSDDYDDY